MSLLFYSLENDLPKMSASSFLQTARPDCGSLFLPPKYEVDDSFVLFSHKLESISGDNNLLSFES